MPGIGRCVVAKNIIREQKLNVAATASADGRCHQARAFTDLRKQRFGNDLDLNRICTGVFQRLDLLINPFCLIESLSYRAQAACPGAPTWNQTSVTLHGNARFRGGFDKAGAPLAHDRIGTRSHRGIPKTNRFFRARRRDQRHRERLERIRRGLANGGRRFRRVRVEAYFHGVDARLFRRDGFLNRKW